MPEHAFISANPDVLVLGPDPGTTTIAWSTGNGQIGQVFVARNGEPEKLFARGADGSRDVAWIVRDSTYRFRLYGPHGPATRLMADVEVVAKPAPPDPDEWFPKRLTLSRANVGTIEFLRTTACERIAEVGIYRGHTSQEIARFLDGRGYLHLYDFADHVDDVVDQLTQQGFSNVVGFGNSRKQFDSYNWSLMRMLQQHPEPIYDYVFLDGAHTWGIDALAFLLIDRLLEVGGYIDFDDYDWIMKFSPSLKPEIFPKTLECYTDEQIAEKQVALVVDLLVKRDPRYETVVEKKIYRKIA